MNTNIIGAFLLFICSITGRTMDIPNQPPSSPARPQIEGNFRFLDEKLRAACNSGMNLVEKLQKGPLRVTITTLIKAGASLQGSRFFNPSITTFEDGYFIAARIAFLENLDSLKDTTIIPGNNDESSFEKGHNFWWMDWADPKFGRGTLYFKADAQLENIQLILPCKAPSEWFTSTDLKMFSKDNQLFVVNAKSGEFVGKIHVTAPRFFVIETIITNSDPQNNFGIIDVSKNTCQYVDWFYESGVKIARIELTEIDLGFDTVRISQRTELMIPYDDGYAFDGNGSSKNDDHRHRHAGELPLLSFGTPHLLTDGIYVGVGHAKILVDALNYPYQPGSHIESFRAQIDGPLKKLLGDKLVRHDAYSSAVSLRKGYHYLMYFYFLKFNDEGTMAEMKMSDAFLPLKESQLTAKNTDYAFTLVFPGSIVKSQINKKERTDVLISAGIGDYSSAVFTLPLAWIIESCRHDVAAMNFSDYQYNFLVFDDSGSAHLRTTVSRE